MKVHITITDDNGATYEAAATLSPIKKPLGGSIRGAKRKHAPETQSTSQLSFASNPRAFMNTHGKQKSGLQRFTLLVAYLAKGKLGHPVSSEEIATVWNRMTKIMGGTFNGAYTTRAKDKGWIDSPKHGAYVLCDSWKDALITA